MNQPRGKAFQPGHPGGPGRPKGRKNNATLEVQQLLGENAKALTTKCIVLAMQGQPAALRLCMDRLLAPQADTHIRFGRTQIQTAADVDRALQRTWKLIARGEIAPAEGESLARILMARKAMIETAEFDERLRRVEERVATTDGTK